MDHHLKYNENDPCYARSKQTYESHIDSLRSNNSKTHGAPSFSYFLRCHECPKKPECIAPQNNKIKCNK